MRGFPALDFDDYHRRVLPARCRSGAGRAAARDVRGARPIAFLLTDGRAYRLTPGADAIAVEPGAEAPTVVELDPRSWSDFVHELHTAAGLLYGGRIRFVRGEPSDLERWEPALRALFSGRPIFDPERCDFRDCAGAPLDLHRRFTLDDADDELRHFLDQTGYLLVERVFARDELARIAAAADRVQATARPGDARSWWAKRVRRAGPLSPHLPRSRGPRDRRAERRPAPPPPGRARGRAAPSHARPLRRSLARDQEPTLLVGSNSLTTHQRARLGGPASVALAPGQPQHRALGSRRGAGRGPLRRDMRGTTFSSITTMFDRGPCWL